MNALASAINAFERAPAPDVLRRAGIDFLVGSARKRLAHAPAGAERRFALEMAERAIAENAAEANDQHYELPPEFFGLILGPHRKYSSCYYRAPDDTLADAEAMALALTAQHAELAEPLTTVTTKDRLALVTVVIRGTRYVIVDIGLRMLKPLELYRAQGFPVDYIIDRTAAGKPLSISAAVRMVGNSVSPPPLAAIARANLDRVAEPERMAA